MRLGPRRVVLAAVSLPLLYGAVCGGVGIFAVHPPRRPVFHSPETYGLAYDEVQLRTRDGLTLRGWFVPREGARAAVVVCHGHPDSREGVAPLLPYLHRGGFHVLAFDFRALGESDGETCTIGAREKLDVLAAVDWLKARPEVDAKRIGVLGFSMGGAAALNAAAESPDIRALATDCTYARLDEMAAARFRPLPTAARAAFGWGVLGVAERLSGMDAHTVAPEEAAARLGGRPLLVIAAEEDRFVPPDHAARLVRAAGPTAELWSVPGAGHCKAFRNDPEAYGARVNSFFAEALTPAEPDLAPASAGPTASPSPPRSK